MICFNKIVTCTVVALGILNKDPVDPDRRLDRDDLDVLIIMSENTHTNKQTENQSQIIPLSSCCGVYIDQISFFA